MSKIFTRTFRVRWREWDIYDHVNNAIYIDYAEEAAMQDFAARGWSHAKLTEAGLSVVAKRVHIQYAAIAEWGRNIKYFHAHAQRR